MNAIFIELTNKNVYLARLEPKTASEDPLTEKERVILDLHRQLEALRQGQSSDGKHYCGKPYGACTDAVIKTDL